MKKDRQQEYREICVGDVVTWKNYIRKCIEEVPNRERGKYLSSVWAELQTTDFVTAPASTHYHHAYDYGLLKHTCETMALALSYDQACLAHIFYQEMITCALLHDYGKVGKYDRNDAKKGHPFLYVPREAVLSDQIRSILYAYKRIPDIAEQEIFAILYHDGLYPNDNNALKNNETPLTMILHWADMWSARMDQFGW